MPHALTETIAADGSGAQAASGPNFLGLTLGWIGGVYGDIGTRPLYALGEAGLAATDSGHATTEPVIHGILSLIIWALILVVTVKYVLILLRADNDGEGGTLALMALANRALGGRSLVIILLGIVSAALFYGDALITPAISVLSAVEGLSLATPALPTYALPLTFLILFALFAVQSHGTARVPPSSDRSRLSGSLPLPSVGSRTSPRTPACSPPSILPMASCSWPWMDWVCNAWRRL